MKVALAALAVAAASALIWFGFLRDDGPSRSAVPPAREPALTADPTPLEFATLPVAAEADADLREGRYVLNGRVTRDGRPVPARVCIRPDAVEGFLWSSKIEAILAPPSPDLPPLAVVTAGADGRFRFLGLAPGTYWVDAETDGAAAREWLGIHPGRPPPLMNLKLEAVDGGVVLRGRAVLADDTPFHGLVIADRKVARTDEEGRFRLHGLHPGKATLSFLDPGAFRAEIEVPVPQEGELLVRVHEGLRSVTGRVVAASDDTQIRGATVSVSGPAGGNVTRSDEAGSFELLIPAGFASLVTEADGFVRSVDDVRAATDIEIRLVRPGKVTGRVFDSTGKVRSGVPVFFSNSGRGCGGDYRSTLSDGKGQFSFADAMPGTAILYAFGAGLVSEAAPEMTGWVNPLVIEVPVSGAIEKDLVVMDTGRVTGRLLDESGAPVGGVTIEALPVEDLQHFGVRTAVSTPEGSFEFEGLIPRCEYEFTAISNRGIASKAGPLSVESGATGAIEIRLTGPRWIELTARDAVTGEPVAGAGVSVRQGEDFAHFLTDRNGHARLGPLLPADARIRVDHGRYLWPSDFLVARAGGPDEIQVDLQPGFHISGAVLEVGGKPAQWGTLVLYEGPGGSSTTRCSGNKGVERDGSFRIGPIPAGEYVLRLYGPLGERKRFPVRAGDEDLLLFVDPAPETPPPEESPDHGEIVVRYSGPDGRPPVGGVVRIHRVENGGWAQQVETRPGVVRFAIREPGGQVRIEVYGASTSDGSPLGGRLVGPVDLKPGETDIRLEPGGEIRGRVVDPDGQGLRGLSLEVWRVDTGRRGRPSPRTGARTGENGSFVIKGIGDGLHEVWVSAPPEFIYPAPVQAEAGGEVEIRLRRGATLRLLFLTESGDPALFVSAFARTDEDLPFRQSGSTNSKGIAYINRLDPEVPIQIRAVGPGKTAALVRDIDPAVGELVIRLRPGGVIRGRFRVPDGADNFEVSAALDGIRASGRVEQDGSFELDGLSPGEWNVAVHTNGANGSLWSGHAKAEPGDTLVIELARRE